MTNTDPYHTNIHIALSIHLIVIEILGIIRALVNIYSNWNSQIIGNSFGRSRWNCVLFLKLLKQTFL